MTKINKIFIWSPFTSKVGTVYNVINFTENLIKFSKKKFDITFINSFGEWNVYKNDLAKKNFRFVNFLNSIFFLNWKKNGFFRSRLSYIIIFFTSLIPLFNLLKKEKPQYLFCYLITSLPLILFFLFNFNTKLILSIAGQPKLNFLRVFLWKKISKKINYIICPSNELKQKLIELDVFDKKKIVVIQDAHLSVKRVNFLKSKELKDNFFKDSKVIISIGRLTKQKNFTFLIKNFSLIHKKYNNYKLAIIGDGEEKESLLKLIKQLDLEEVIKIIEYKINIYNYLKASYCYISTSDWEGSSLAMIDAAAVGLPIICSDCPTGRKEFIGNDERGYLFMQNNSDDFLNKFDKMINEDFTKLFRKLVCAKKEVKKFTSFSHFLGIKRLLQENQVK
tara:strand:+ start:213 stop:1385 length:1173 start_codon:yes stop_codon:yes gene_type:complete